MKLKLPAGSFRAYLFDCDGTIADSMPLHYKAWKKALAEYESPAIDPAIDEALRDYIERKKASLPDATY